MLPSLCDEGKGLGTARFRRILKFLDGCLACRTCCWKDKAWACQPERCDAAFRPDDVSKPDPERRNSDVQPRNWVGFCELACSPRPVFPRPGGRDPRCRSEG